MAAPALLIRTEFEFQDLVDSLSRAPDLILRDFALMTVAAKVVEHLGDQLCFKGGFVLRHVYGHDRFSKDIDATRINPPKSRLNAHEVGELIDSASMRNLLTVRAGEPATDSKRGLDFDRVTFRGPLGVGSIAIEVSYREDVILEPVWLEVGPPYYEPFQIPVMQIDEIVAEKLRTLAQRSRPTDLSDLAEILANQDVDREKVRQLVSEKFRLVKQGDKKARIERNMTSIGTEYEAAIKAVAPGAPGYAEAVKVVGAALSDLLP